VVFIACLDVRNGLDYIGILYDSHTPSIGDEKCSMNQEFTATSMVILSIYEEI
jgi:hypothetical protein